MLISYSRVFKFALKDFWRNLGLSLMTISILLLTYFSLNLLVLVNFFTEAAIQSIESRVDISVYFGPDVSDDRILGVRGNLTSLPEVTKSWILNTLPVSTTPRITKESTVIG